MKRIMWSVLALVLLLGMGYSIVGLVTRDSPTLPRPKDRALAERVTVAPANTPEAVPDFLDTGLLGADPSTVVGGNGVVEPAGEETQVSSEVAGRVSAVLVKEGDQVAAGAVLVQLEDASERANVAVAEAQLEAARVTRDKVKRGSRDEDVRRAIAQAREAEARASLSRGIFDRTKRLGDGGSATEDEVDRARRASEADAFAAKAADANKAAIVNGSRAEDIAEAEAQVRIAEARLAEATARLEQRSVRAPIAGEALQVKVRAGEYLQPGTAPVVLGDTRKLMVRIDVDERDYARVAVGAPVKVSARAFGATMFAGTVHSLGRRMGRKNLRTDDPVERNDTKILEVLVALDDFKGLVVGQRVIAYVQVK